MSCQASILGRRSSSRLRRQAVISELFEELVDLVESPRVLKGEIADQYLDLPPEVIVTVMQSHQRYVPLKRPQASADPLQLEARSVLLSTCW